MRSRGDDRSGKEDARHEDTENLVKSLVLCYWPLNDGSFPAISVCLLGFPDEEQLKQHLDQQTSYCFASYFGKRPLGLQVLVLEGW